MEILALSRTYQDAKSPWRISIHTDVVSSSTSWDGSDYCTCSHIRIWEIKIWSGRWIMVWGGHKHIWVPSATANGRNLKWTSQSIKREKLIGIEIVVQSNILLNIWGKNGWNGNWSSLEDHFKMEFHKNRIGRTTMPKTPEEYAFTPM